jgi:hypothetical protein
VCSSLCSFVFEGFFKVVFGIFLFLIIIVTILFLVFVGWDFGVFFFLFGAVWFWVFRCASVGGGLFGGRFVCLLVGWFVVVGTGNWLLLLLSLLLLLLAK